MGSSTPLYHKILKEKMVRSPEFHHSLQQFFPNPAKWRVNLNINNIKISSIVSARKKNRRKIQIECQLDPK